MQATVTSISFLIIGVLCILLFAFFIARCLTQGRTCPSRCSVEGRTVLVTAADSAVGVELTRELCRRGARVIMAVKDTELGQDVAVEVRGETNGEIVVEYCDMASLKSIREFCTKVLEQESRLHVLVNNACIMWPPLQRTSEGGFEMHWAVNHLGAFVMTQLLMPLLHRGAPDARVITVTSSLFKKGYIKWDDPNYHESAYSASEAYNQSSLANVLFTRELARRLDGTGINTYCVNPGPVATGLGSHVLPGLGCSCGLLFALLCWLPWLRPAERAVQTIVYCATDANLSEQTGLYYSDCAVQLTPDKAADMEDAYRLWEMSERMAGLTS